MDERRTKHHEAVPVDYRALFEAASPAAREQSFAALLAEAWSGAYARATAWEPHVLEVALGRLTYLFDAAPSLEGADGEDRVVGVLGWSARPPAQRDAARMAGFLPGARRWSGSGLDRGHFVSHAAGGGTDLNLFPQPAALNRGRTPDGRRWRAFERAVAAREGTFHFVRPRYDDPTWVPVELEAGYVSGADLVVERFANR